MRRLPGIGHDRRRCDRVPLDCRVLSGLPACGRGAPADGDGLGLGDGGHGGQVNGGQRGPQDECAGELGHGGLRSINWRCGDDGLAARRRRLATGPAATSHGRPPPSPARRASATRSRAWAACSCRWVMRCSARTWLSPACWLFMGPSLPAAPPACPAARATLVVAGRLRMALRRAARIRHVPYAGDVAAPHLWSLTPYGRRFPLAGRAG